MRLKLFPFQETAVATLHSLLDKAHKIWSETDPQIITFSAPTGSGKTIIMTALFEEMVYGSEYSLADPDSVFVWLSDMPELNHQTLLKIESQSDKFHSHDITVIDSSYDAEYFEPGIYFLNTQKLGSDKLLTQRGDSRQYTIWQTLANTAERQPLSCYVVIDEAHRGSFTTQAVNKAQSIMQKFVLGSPEDNFPIMPLVIGMTATPERFENLAKQSHPTTHSYAIPPEEVIASGLLKDRIIVHYPDMAINAAQTMFREAVKNWKIKCDHWQAYCQKQGIKNVVKPILVVQVEDAKDKAATQTDLSYCLDTLEAVLERKLLVGEAVQTFDTHESITVRDLEIHKIDASRIQEDEKVLVVFFKMNLSTGWDCPRAETMMSFRHANDYTYIAQLLGRMIRTPLARRVQDDAELNNVGLFLPFFDEATVKSVEQALRESEAIAPSETGSHKNLLTLQRNPEYKEIFKKMHLITYQIDKVRKTPALRRLMDLARALNQDALDLLARKVVLEKILNKFNTEIQSLKQSGSFDSIAQKITGLKVKAITIDYNDLRMHTKTSSKESSQESKKSESTLVALADFDLNILFTRAGKSLGNGLHMEYWTEKAKQISTRKEYDERAIKIEMIVMTNSQECMKNIQDFAEQEFNKLYEKNREAIADLREERRRDHYQKLAMASATPLPMAWDLPHSIDFVLGKDPQVYEKHLYIPEDGEFRATLNNWESDLVKEELANGAVAWLRNLDRKKWALEIPYEIDGVATPMYPDLLIVRKKEKGYVFDILEPHDPSRKDNCAKAVGMAKFAEKHGGKFGRIQLIRKQKGEDGKEHFFRLNINALAVRNKLRGLTSNAELDRIFEQEAYPEAQKEIDTKETY